MTVDTFPAWPEDVPTHPLLIIDYRLLRKKDPSEVDRLWEAATTLGFWYLKNHGADTAVAEMFDLGAAVMALPLEEMMKYEQGDQGESFGYKMAGGDVVSPSGELDTAEFLNPRLVRRKTPSYPPPVLFHMESVVRPFILKSLEVTNTTIDIFNDKLGMAKGRLLELHSDAEWSGSQARIIRNKATNSTVKVATGSHTDFGSLSFLHNKQGGLQVLPPGADLWQYIEPIQDHAICNVGDALSILSGGLLRSNVHRVLPPPPTQANTERWSLVFFSRLGDSVILRALAEESPVVAEIVKKKSSGGSEKSHPHVTAQEWCQRRVKNRRMANRQATKTWEASLGTEGVNLF
ncbi:Clavaminate synthase-like protein [Gymnopilus junonius]|uniref:Clavaminate synthase-like protein n=1 Tax=Gymnopilus junonius TaxID=109634 RepID=A0A9P5TJ95_GYMJU|nr:Clavaminate synthase-like protein [Gymnopilus junonius]